MGDKTAVTSIMVVRVVPLIIRLVANVLDITYADARAQAEAAATLG